MFEILSSHRYYGQFKTTPQYLKVLSEIDFSDSLTDNSGWCLLSTHTPPDPLVPLDAMSISSNNSNEISGDYSEQQFSPAAASSPAATAPDMLDNVHNYLITTEINDSGSGIFDRSIRTDRAFVYRCLLREGRQIRHLCDFRLLQTIERSRTARR